MNVFSYIKNSISRLIAPPFCIECRFFLPKNNNTGLYLCAECLDLIKPIVSKQLLISPSCTVTVHALGEYTPPLTSLIRAKNTGVRSSTLQLAELMARAEILKTLSFDYIVAVPVHWTKKLYRGFNQAEEIACFIAKKTNSSYISGIIKHKKTLNQGSLNRELRSSNVKDVFALNNKSACFKKKHILLIDDVMTTGSTITAVARTLMLAEPASITVFVGARVVD